MILRRKRKEREQEEQEQLPTNFGRGRRISPKKRRKHFEEKKKGISSLLHRERSTNGPSPLAPYFEPKGREGLYAGKKVFNKIRGER